jgi:molybdate transport system regulatory protein
MSRPNLVTNTDVALLRSLARERSLVRASREVGISRDRAVYRIGRMARAFGGPVVRATRGGSSGGGTTLTPLGDRIARGGFDSVELVAGWPLPPTDAPNVLHGTYRRAPSPTVDVGRGLSLRVAFDAEDGEPVTLLLDPETILVARERFASSARNVLTGTVASLRRERGRAHPTLTVRVGPQRLRVAVTDEPVRQLGLAPGVPVLLYVKATALRRVGAPTRGSPRS